MSDLLADHRALVQEALPDRDTGGGAGLRGSSGARIRLGAQSRGHSRQRTPSSPKTDSKPPSPKSAFPLPPRPPPPPTAAAAAAPPRTGAAAPPPTGDRLRHGDIIKLETSTPAEARLFLHSEPCLAAGVVSGARPSDSSEALWRVLPSLEYRKYAEYKAAQRLVLADQAARAGAESTVASSVSSGWSGTSEEDAEDALAPVSKRELSALFEQSEREHRINSRTVAEVTARGGGPVRYGDRLQLQSLRTGRMLCLDANASSVSEPEARRLGLTDRTEAGCHFCFKPRFKFRKLGGAVHSGDEAVIATEAARFVGIARERSYAAAEAYYEATAGISPAFSFLAVLYRSVEESQAGGLQIGSENRLWHAEAEGYVSASADLARHKPPYVRHASQDGSGPDAPKHLSAKGMWRLEAAGPWPRGGPVQYGAPYLLRHVPSGRYLALAADTGRSVVGGETVYDAVLLPRPPDHHGEKNFVFHLHPAAPPGGGEDTSAVVQKHASVFLRCRALGTNAPVQLSSPAGSVKSPDKPSSLTLLFTTVERPEDAFLLFPVAEVESQAVRLIASYPRWVDRYTSVVAALGQTYDAAGRAETEIPFLGHQLALIGEVLSELILDLILGDQDRATDSALEVTGPSDKVLQHMALETKLVDRIFAAIDAPLNAPPNRALSLQSDLKAGTFTDARFALVKVCHKLCFRALNFIFKDNAKAQLYVASRTCERVGGGARLSWPDALILQLSYPVGAEECLSSLLRDNRALLAGYVTPGMLRLFKQLITDNGPRAPLLAFFSTVCVCDGQALIKTQEMILNELLRSPAARDAVMFTVRALDLPGQPRWKWTADAHKLPAGGTCLGEAERKKGFLPVYVRWTGHGQWPDCDKAFLFHDAASLGLETHAAAGFSDWVPIVDLCKALRRAENAADRARAGAASLLSGDATAALLADDNNAEERDRQKAKRRQLQLGEYLVAQIALFASLAHERSYNAIGTLQEDFSYELVVACAAHEDLPCGLRAAFARLLVSLWIDRYPHAPLALPATVWDANDLHAAGPKDILPRFALLSETGGEGDAARASERASTPNRSSTPLRKRMSTLTAVPRSSTIAKEAEAREQARRARFLEFTSSGKFHLAQELIATFMRVMNGDQNHTQLEKNDLCLALMSVLQTLVEFGFYGERRLLLETFTPMVPALDGRDDSVAYDPSFARRRPDLLDRRYEKDEQSVNVTKSKAAINRACLTVLRVQSELRMRQVLVHFARRKRSLEGHGATLAEAKSFDTLVRKDAEILIDLDALGDVDVTTALIDLLMYDGDTELFETSLELLRDLSERRSRVLAYLDDVVLLPNRYLPVFGDLDKLKFVTHRLRHLVTAYEIWAADDNWAFFLETETGLQDLSRLMRTCTSENCAPETATFASTRCAASLERRVSRFSEDGLLGVHDEKVEGRATATAVAHAQARYPVNGRFQHVCENLGLIEIFVEAAAIDPSLSLTGASGGSAGKRVRRLKDVLRVAVNALSTISEDHADNQLLIAEEMPTLLARFTEDGGGGAPLDPILLATVLDGARTLCREVVDALCGPIVEKFFAAAKRLSTPGTKRRSENHQNGASSEDAVTYLGLLHILAQPEIGAPGHAASQRAVLDALTRGSDAGREAVLELCKSGPPGVAAAVFSVLVACVRGREATDLCSIVPLSVCTSMTQRAPALASPLERLRAAGATKVLVLAYLSTPSAVEAFKGHADCGVTLSAAAASLAVAVGEATVSPLEVECVEACLGLVDRTVGMADITSKPAWLGPLVAALQGTAECVALPAPTREWADEIHSRCDRLAHKRHLTRIDEYAGSPPLPPRSAAAAAPARASAGGAGEVYSMFKKYAASLRAHPLTVAGIEKEECTLLRNLQNAAALTDPRRTPALWDEDAPLPPTITWPDLVQRLSSFIRANLHEPNYDTKVYLLKMFRKHLEGVPDLAPEERDDAPPPTAARQWATAGLKVLNHKYELIAIMTLVVVGLAIDIMRYTAAAALVDKPPVYAAELVISAVFAVELISRIVSMAVRYGHSDAYHRFVNDRFCMLDLIVVLIDAGSLAMGIAFSSGASFGKYAKALRALRMLRFLRALRAGKALAALARSLRSQKKVVLNARQDVLDRLGVTTLVYELMATSSHSGETMASLELGCELMNQGNTAIQNRFLTVALTDDPEGRFFSRMQQRIGNAAKEQAKAIAARLKKQAEASNNAVELGLSSKLRRRRSFSKSPVDTLGPGPKRWYAVFNKGGTDASAASSTETEREATTCLRFLQLLAEGHRAEWQRLLREQAHARQSYNLVASVLELVAQLCESPSAVRGITPSALEMLCAALDFLVEVCQGPCRENQELCARSPAFELCQAVVFSSSFSDVGGALQAKSKVLSLLCSALELRLDTTVHQLVAEKMQPAFIACAMNWAIKEHAYLNEAKEVLQADEFAAAASSEEGEEGGGGGMSDAMLAAIECSELIVGFEVNLALVKEELQPHLAAADMDLAAAANDVVVGGDGGGDDAEDATAKLDAEIAALASIVRVGVCLEDRIFLLGFPKPTIGAALRAETKESFLATCPLSTPEARATALLKRVPLFIAEMNHLAALESSSKLYRFVKPVQAELRTFATGVAFLAVLNALLYVEAPHFAAASNGPRSKAPGIGALAAGGATSTAEALGAWLAVLLMVVHLVLLSYRLLSDAPLISKARALSEREDAAETALPQRTVQAFVAALARPTAIDAAAVGAAVAVVALNRALEQYMVAVAIVCLAVRLLSKARRLVGAPRGAAGLAYAVVYDVAGHVPIVSHLAVAALAALALCHRPTWCGAALCVDLATAGIAPIVNVLGVFKDSGTQLVWIILLLVSLNVAFAFVAYDGFGPAHFEWHCETLLECSSLAVHDGLLNKGKIFVSLDEPYIGGSGHGDYYVARWWFDHAVNLLCNIFLYTTITGTVVNTYMKRRTATLARAQVLGNEGYVTGVSRAKCAELGVDFDEMEDGAFNTWNYLLLLTYLTEKDANDYTGPETMIWKKYCRNELGWVPTRAPKVLAMLVRE